MTRLSWRGLVIVALLAVSIPTRAEQTATNQDKVQNSSAEQATTDKRAEAVKASARLSAIDIAYADAMSLYVANRHFEALPLLEKLAERYPTDIVAVERLGFALIITSAAGNTPEERKQQRARGRQFLVRAQELGADDELNAYYLSTLPEDGGLDTAFSSRKEVEEVMQEGERAYSRNDYAAAIKAYTHATLLDPTLYTAVLFVGDSYYADHQYANACEWFLRATKVDPNQETAYRYWGDALMHQEKMAEAKLKFIEATIAEPYSRKSWIGLKQWADRNASVLGHPDIKAPQRPKSTGKDGGGVNIAFDINSLLGQGKKDGTSAWMTYQLISGAWQAELFKKNHPEEKQYRHTLAEEESALSAVAESVDEKLKKGELKAKDLDPGIAILMKLHKAKMLAPFILISRADEGIARDYEEYRDRNRDTLRQYVRDFILSAK